MIPNAPVVLTRGSGEPAPLCWSCRQYQATDRPERASLQWCALNHAGFPTIGRRCRSYAYEPGSDAGEVGLHP